MKQDIVSVFDSAAGAFGRPIFVPAIGLAMRSFTQEVNAVREDNQMNKHPSDFVLYRLGEFDDSTGAISGLDRPEVLARAVDVYVKPSL